MFALLVLASTIAVVTSVLSIWQFRHIRNLERIAYIDELTQVGNRRYFEAQLRMAVAHILRSREPLGLLVIDLNNLKPINDAHGHGAGDRLLRALAEALRATARPSDCVCRVGGDEFIVLLPSCSREGLDTVVRRLRDHLLATHLVIANETTPIRISVGGTCLTIVEGRVFVGRNYITDTRRRDAVAEVAKVLVETADLAMYEAKQNKDTQDMPVTLR